MPTLRDSLLPALDNARTLVANLGLRQHGLTIRVRTWANGRIGDPFPGVADTDYTDEDLEIAPNPKVRAVTGQEIASSGGLYATGDLLVGPFTPAYSGGGYTMEQLAPEPAAQGVEVIYALTGPEAGEYVRVDRNGERPMRYELVLRRRFTTP